MSMTDFLLSTVLSSLGLCLSPTFQAAYDQLNRDLSADATLAFVSDNRETLLAAFRKHWRKGSLKERIAASKLCMTAFICLGPDAEDALEDMTPVIRTMIGDKTVNGLARAEGIRALAMAVFVVEEDDAITQETMSFFLEQFKGASPGLKVAIFESWSLLATTLPDKTIAKNFFVTLIPLIESSLENESLELRLAAGNTVGQLYAAVAGEPEHKTISLENLHSMLKDLSTDMRRYRAKEERSSQKSVFRAVLDTIEKGEEPEETIAIGRQDLKFDSWEAIAQLNAFRYALASGLQNHLFYNELLRDIFSVDVTTLVSKAVNKSENQEVQRNRARAAHNRKRFRQQTRDRKASRNEFFAYGGESLSTIVASASPVGSSDAAVPEPTTTSTTEPVKESETAAAAEAEAPPTEAVAAQQ